MRRHGLCFKERQVGPIALIAWVWWASVAALIPAPSPAQAQAPAAGEYSPAQFLRAENLGFYFEFDGFDAHADGWRQTAAAQILTETTTGAMLEELFVKLFPKSPQGTLTGPEKLALLKHVMKAGFTLGANMAREGDKDVGAIVMVFRGAFANKEVRPLLARFLQELPKPGTKAQAVVKSGHKLVSGQNKAGPYVWWVEETRKEDVIFAIGPPGLEDYVAETLNGTKPTAVTHPTRVELTNRQEGFERTSLMFLDVAVLKQSTERPEALAFFDQIKIHKLDFVGGFQANALATVTRLHSSAVAPGSLSTSGGFTRQTIPNVPPGILGMMVLGFNSRVVIDEIKKYPGSGMERFHDSLATLLREKANKVRLDEDILARLGPKITTYVMPNKTGTAPTSGLNGAFGLLLKAGGSSFDWIPKGAILIDVNDAAAFGKSLDEVMSFANRSLKAAYAPPPGDAPPDAPPPPPGGRNRMRGPAGPTPEFRVMSGETKSYVFTVPPELSSAFPAGFRPTIRLGPKQVSIAASAEVARQALDAKGTYAAPAEIAAAFDKLPARLNWLLVVDPRTSAPEILASLPGKLQSGINMMITPTTATPAVAPAEAGRAGQGARPGQFTRADGPGATSAGGGPGAPAPADAATTPPAGGGPVNLQIDPSKLPAAEAIRKLLFPAIYTVEEEGNVVRFTSRAAFPPVLDPSIAGLVARFVRSRQLPAPAANRPVTDGFFDVPQDPARSAPKPPTAPAGAGAPSAKPVD